MTGKIYGETIVQDMGDSNTFVTNKRHIFLFKLESMYHCSSIKEGLERIMGEYNDDQLMVHYIDADEEEALKLSYWTYFVPTLYVIDTDGYAYILPVMEIIHDYDTFSLNFK